MRVYEYQYLARRTQNPSLSPEHRIEHATWGLAAEVGEILSLHQKTHQGHRMPIDKLKEEIGDCGWFLGELCDAYDLDLEDILEENIDKLRKRYPEGFSAERSINREV